MLNKTTPVVGIAMAPGDLVDNQDVDGLPRPEFLDVVSKRRILLREDVAFDENRHLNILKVRLLLDELWCKLKQC